MVTLMNLQDAGLFKIKDKKSPGYYDWQWEKIKNTFDLINEEGSARLTNPTDISYVHNGFKPISIRILELIIENGGISHMSQAGNGKLKMINMTDDKLKIAPTESKLFP